MSRRNILVGTLLVLILLVIMPIVYYYPVIDRLAIRPCHYYPETFADCK